MTRRSAAPRAGQQRICKHNGRQAKVLEVDQKLLGPREVWRGGFQGDNGLPVEVASGSRDKPYCRTRVQLQAWNMLLNIGKEMLEDKNRTREWWIR